MQAAKDPEADLRSPWLQDRFGPARPVVFQEGEVQGEVTGAPGAEPWLARSPG